MIFKSPLGIRARVETVTAFGELYHLVKYRKWYRRRWLTLMHDCRPRIFYNKTHALIVAQNIKDFI